MRDFGFLMKWARYFSFAAVAMATLPAMSALAARPGHRPNYCPPQQYCPQDEYAPGGQPHAAQSMDSNATDGSATTDGQTQTQDQNQALAPQANNADLNLSAQNSDFQVAASGDGSNVGHIGRADNFNRLNIFDSQSAIPSNRVYFGTQYLDRFRVTNDPLAPDQTVAQVLYRMGGEIKVTDSSSITFQTQYVNVTGTYDLGGGAPLLDSWSNPQLMAKQIVYQDCDLVVSGTFGVQIPIGGVDLGEFRETTTRIAPGMLFYSNTTCDVFNYGGFQFSIPLASDQQVDTFDWAIGTGYWLYRNNCCCGGFLDRVSLQYEVFGKHSVGTTNQAYIGNGPVGPFAFTVSENRNVFDMTAGISFFLCNGVRASVGYSIPVGRSFVRHNELIGTIGYYF